MIRGSRREGSLLITRNAVLLILGAALSSCTDDGRLPAGGGTESGPLSFTAGHVEVMMAASPRAMFGALAGCLTEGSPAEVTVTDVEAVEATGVEDVAFEVAWTANTEPLRRGGGPVSKLPAAFEAAPTGGDPESASRGQVAGCTERNTGLALAVLLPVPSESAVVVDGIAVSYELDGRDYSTVVDATIGVCAADPASSSEQPETCRGGSAFAVGQARNRDGYPVRPDASG
jgi:hypothetical protein